MYSAQALADRAKFFSRGRFRGYTGLKNRRLSFKSRLENEFPNSVHRDFGGRVGTLPGTLRKRQGKPAFIAGPTFAGTRAGVGRLLSSQIAIQFLFQGHPTSRVTRRMIYNLECISSEAQMQVAKWGNSLAVRLPAAVVEALELKEGDDIEIRIAGKREFEVDRDRTKERALNRLRRLRRPLPAGFSFSREEANER